MSLRAELSEQQLQQRWEAIVRPALFVGRSPSPHPTVVLIGGQPGCGKTVGLGRVLDMYPDEVFTPLIGDDLRPYHPDFMQALDDPDEAVMPAVTAQASGAWVRMGIEHAAEHGYSAVVEGTFRDPQTTLATAARFADAGHQVHVVALAVPAVMSRLSCLERYYGQRAAGNPGRWTSPAAHDLGYEGTPRTVEAAENDPSVHRLTVMDRAGNLLYDNTRGPDGQWQNPTGARQALEARRDRPLTAQETGWWQSTATQVRNWAAQVGLSPHSRDALEQLSTVAARPILDAELRRQIAADEREADRRNAAAHRQDAEARRIREGAAAGEGPAMRELHQRRDQLRARIDAAAAADAARSAAAAGYATSRQAWQDVHRLEHERQRHPLALRMAGTSRAQIAAEQEHLRETARTAAADAVQYDARARDLDTQAGGPGGGHRAAAELAELNRQWEHHVTQARERDTRAADALERSAQVHRGHAAVLQCRAAGLHAELARRDGMDPDARRQFQMKQAAHRAEAEKAALPESNQPEIEPGPSL